MKLMVLFGLQVQAAYVTGAALPCQPVLANCTDCACCPTLCTRVICLSSTTTKPAVHDTAVAKRLSVEQRCA